MSNELNCTITPLNDMTKGQCLQYNQIDDASPQSTIYHTLEWNRIVEKFSGAEAKVALAFDEGRVPVGAFLYYLEKIGPRKLVRAIKSPYQKLESHYGGPFSTGNENAIRSLLKYVESKESPGIISLKLSPKSDIALYNEFGYEITPGQTAYIDLTSDEDILWSNMDKSTKKKVKKAENSQIEVSMADKEVLDVYSEISIESAGRSEISSLPEGYFKDIFNALHASGQCLILMAKKEDENIAGAFYLMHKDTVYSWHSCSRTEYRSLGANSLIKWKFIKLAKERGFKKYDLMGLDVQSIAQYKLGFGGVEVSLHSAVKKKGLMGIKSKLRSNK